MSAAALLLGSGPFGALGARNTRLVVKRKKTGMDSNRNPVYEYTVADGFAILGGTSTNCARGETPFQKWLTCEEVVKGPTGGSDGKVAAKKHGYIYEVNAMSVPRPCESRDVYYAQVENQGTTASRAARCSPSGISRTPRRTPAPRHPAAAADAFERARDVTS